MLRKLKALSLQERSNYGMVLGLVAVSGFPFFFGSVLNSVALFMFAMFVFLKRGERFNTKVLSIVGLFFLVEMLQNVFIYRIAMTTMIGTYIRFFMGILIVMMCERNFTRYYVNLIYALTVFGFFFYVPSVLSNNIRDFFTNTVCSFFPAIGSGSDSSDGFYVAQPTIMFYTFHEVLKDFRNSGPFWEPGAYGVFLNLALIFNIINTKTLITKKNIVFGVAIISTLSTTGFVAFFIVVASYYLVVGSLSRKTFMLSMLVPVSIYMFVTLDFLGDKVEKNMELKDDSTSRFGSFYADVKDWSTSPVIGWGKGEMRFGGKEFTFFTEEQHRNNGLSDLLATYGIFVFVVVLLNYYRTFKVLCLANDFNKTFALLAFAVVLLLGFSQSIFQYPFFLSLMFIHYMYAKWIPREELPTLSSTTGT
ncbi:MAG: hypothetical protein KDD36_01695 [Flavobacteriales bacterium]|nr:hypothetical protein [Flavobacteriales bacterium]